MHNKTTTPVSLGGEATCGSRKIRIDAVDNNIIDVTLTIKKGETVEIRDPRQKDSAWILDDPGEGEMIESAHAVTLGHKIRVGNFRQFRIVEQNGNMFNVRVVGPDTEI